MFLKLTRFRFADKTVFYYRAVHALGPSTLRIRRLISRKQVGGDLPQASAL
jgi:hypothetical protein